METTNRTELALFPEPEWLQRARETRGESAVFEMKTQTVTHLAEKMGVPVETVRVEPEAEDLSGVPVRPRPPTLWEIADHAVGQGAELKVGWRFLGTVKGSCLNIEGQDFKVISDLLFEAADDLYRSPHHTVPLSAVLQAKRDRARQTVVDAFSNMRTERVKDGVAVWFPDLPYEFG